MSSLFSRFSVSSSRKSSSAQSGTLSLTTPEPSPTRNGFLTEPGDSNPKESRTHRSFDSRLLVSPRYSSISKVPSPRSASYPSANTQTRISPTTIPSQKFLTNMPLSLALRTATIATPLPVVRPTNVAEEKSKSKMRTRLFGSNKKQQVSSPGMYELAGRSTFALVQGAILRYHSEFGDDPDGNATPDSTHFLNGSSIICVSDAIQGFKWVLEIKTFCKTGIRSPIKRSKSKQNVHEKTIDFTKLPWGIVDGLQAWYLVFENAHLMTEWMTILRVAVTDIKEKEAKQPKSPGHKTPKGQSKSERKSGKKKIRTPLMNSPTSSSTESLPSSPSSSRLSFLGRSMENYFGKPTSVTEEPEEASKRHSGGSIGSVTSVEGGHPQPRLRNPSQQDIALTAFRISAYEEDLADFVPPQPETSESSSRTTITPYLKTETVVKKEPETQQAPPLTPNLTHSSSKRTSLISLQSRISSMSSGPRTPRSAVSPTSSPSSPSLSASHPRRRHNLGRTRSGESSKPESILLSPSKDLPPPHPPPTGPLPIPPTSQSHSYYVARGDTTFDLFDDAVGFSQRESLILGISPVFETDTPKTLQLEDTTPRHSPRIDIQLDPAVLLDGSREM